MKKGATGQSFIRKEITTYRIATLAGVAQIQIEVVSCRSDLFPYYIKRGFKEIRRYPFEEYNPACRLTRSGIQMVVMQKIGKFDQN